MLVVHFGKSATASMFVRPLSAVFVCVRYNQSGYLRFRTTNTSNHPILSMKKNNSVNFFSVTNIREKSCRVSVPVKIYNSVVAAKNHRLCDFLVTSHLSPHDFLPSCFSKPLVL